MNTRAMTGGRRFDRIALALVGALAVALVPTGCGGDDPAPSTSTLSAPTAEVSPVEIDIAVPEALEAGRLVASQTACLACHLIGPSGNDGPGPELTDVGVELSRAEIADAVAKGPGIMPRYVALKKEEPQKFEDLVAFLSWLGTE